MFPLYLYGVLMFHTEPRFHSISLFMRHGQDICPSLLSCVEDRRRSSKVQLFYGHIRRMSQFQCVDPSPTLFTYLSPSNRLLPELVLPSQSSDQSGLFLWLLLHNVGFYLPERHKMSQPPVTFVIIGAKASTGVYLCAFLSHFHMNTGTCSKFSCFRVWIVAVHKSIQLSDTDRVYFFRRKGLIKWCKRGLP